MRYSINTQCSALNWFLYAAATSWKPCDQDGTVGWLLLYFMLFLLLEYDYPLQEQVVAVDYFWKDLTATKTVNIFCHWCQKRQFSREFQCNLLNKWRMAMTILWKTNIKPYATIFDDFLYWCTTTFTVILHLKQGCKGNNMLYFVLYFSFPRFC